MASRTRLWLMIAVGAVIGAAAGLVGGAVWLGGSSYENPVVENDAPDPSVIRAEDGLYYAYTTQSYHEAAFFNIPVLRSPDLIEWELVGDAFDERPDWTPPGVDRGDMWAPHIVRFDGTYVLYYSARNFRLGNMAIGVATSQSPTGPFVDPIGEPLVIGDRGFDAIDPFAMEAPDGRRYLYWGSDGIPIRVQPLTEDGLSLEGEPMDLVAPSDAEYEGLVEGAWMLERDGWWHLMYSGDACCGMEAHYAVLTARSRSWLGPFERFAGNPILAANEDFTAPGHHATITDEAGRDWMLYHAMVRDDFTGYRYLFLDPIEWEDGWPVVNGGDGPSAAVDSAPSI